MACRLPLLVPHSPDEGGLLAGDERGVPDLLEEAAELASLIENPPLVAQVSIPDPGHGLVDGQVSNDLRERAPQSCHKFPGEFDVIDGAHELDERVFVVHIAARRRSGVDHPAEHFERFIARMMRTDWMLLSAPLRPVHTRIVCAFGAGEPLAARGAGEGRGSDTGPSSGFKRGATPR